MGGLLAWLRGVGAVCGSAGGSHTDTTNYALDQRPWMRPHEIATLDPQKKIVFRRGKVGPEGQPFSVVRKIWVAEHPQLKGLVG